MRIFKYFIISALLFALSLSSASAGTDHNIRGKAKIVGGSLEFDGISSRVSINYDNPIYETSVVAWFKSQGVPAGDYHIITGGQRVEISIHSSGFIRTGVHTNTQGRKVFNSGSGLTDGNWHQVAMTYDGINLRSFIDGVQTAINPVSGNLTGIAQEIGRYLSDSYAANGLIDDVRIYDRALSEAEVGNLYQGVDISDGLIGHWRFDEGQGSVAYDSSGNNNHGTLVNGPQWSDDTPNIPSPYIYFNCIDEDTGRFPFTFPFYFSVDPCTLEFSGYNVGDDGYGVKIDDDNILGGYARAEIGISGLISFQDGIPPEEEYNTLYNNCPGVNISNCNQDNGCSACYNEETERVYGWAKVIDDGSFIQLHNLVGDDGTIMNNYNSSNPGHFLKYARHDAWGKISFNCLNDFSCGTESYSVYRWDLKLKEMSAPNWSYAQACSSQGALNVVFKWKLISGLQTHFEIKMSAENNVDTAISSGKIFSSNKQLTCPGASCIPVLYNLLDYNTPYYWWLKLYDDDNDQQTDWIQFNHQEGGIGVLTDNKGVNLSNLTFTTYRHEFPSPFFDWSPQSIIAGTSTDFWVTDSSGYYTESKPNEMFSCYGDDCGALFNWTSNSHAYIDSPSTATTSIIFNRITSGQTITLKMTDPTGYYCSITESMGMINYNLPLWREVKP